MNSGNGMFVIILICMCMIASCWGVRKLTEREDRAVLVKNKEAVMHADSTKYLIFTPGRVYENSDALLDGKFNSSDVYNDLEVGKCYDIRSNMFRVQFLSWYENIIDFKPVQCPKPK